MKTKGLDPSAIFRLALLKPQRSSSARSFRSRSGPAEASTAEAGATVGCAFVGVNLDLAAATHVWPEQRVGKTVDGLNLSAYVVKLRNLVKDGKPLHTGGDPPASFKVVGCFVPIDEHEGLGYVCQRCD